MSTLTENLSPLLSAEPQNAHLPEWFTQQSASALDEARITPLPTLRDETWRFGQRAQLTDLSALKPAQPLADTSGLTERHQGTAKPAAKLIFANDQLLEATIPAKWAQQGIIVEPLAEAFAKHPELVQTHFRNQSVRLGTEQFAAAHTAYLQNGLFVYLPADQAIEGTIEVTHFIGGEGNCSFPHTLIIAERGAKVEVFEQFLSADESEHGLIGMVDLVAHESAKLTYASAQDLNRKSRFFQFQTLLTEAHAQLTALALQLGSAWSRQQSYSRLTGAEARADMLAAVIASGEQSFDNRTLQVHEAAGATSDLLYKNALFDDAKSVFSGLIVVEPGAHNTDAYQTCRNLLNSDRVEAHSLPGLEIHADQVACSHGSTSAQIEKDELFYLQARGIDEQAARHLISRGFLADVLSRLDKGELQTHLEERIENALQIAER